MALLRYHHCGVLTTRGRPCLPSHALLRCKHKARRCSVGTRASADEAGDAAEEPPTVMGDWREFRAKLIAEAGAAPMWSSRVTEENKRLLDEQTPYLASEQLWAHATAGPETGGLLLATSAAAVINENYTQAVIFLVSHSAASGSVGLLLNRPTGLLLGRKRGGLPFEVAGATTHMQNVFQDNRVYCGGFTAQQVLHILHGHKLPEAVEIVPGVYIGGQDAATKAVEAGQLQANDFKFFAGALAWTPGVLEEQIKKGAWYTAAASRPIVLKQCLQLPKPLWREVLELMGGEHAAAANEAYRRLQQPDE